ISARNRRRSGSRSTVPLMLSQRGLRKCTARLLSMRARERVRSMITRILVAPLAVVLAAASSDGALAQFYKGKTITMIVNYPAGGPTDIEGRIVAQHLPAHIPGNPTVVIKNVGGAGGAEGRHPLRAGAA